MEQKIYLKKYWQKITHIYQKQQPADPEITANSKQDNYKEVTPKSTRAKLLKTKDKKAAR